MKNSPLAMTSKNGGITFVGSNNRYNSFQIDGTVANDVFGLSAGGTNGAQTGANPISMDAIQEIQVVVVLYDVCQSGIYGRRYQRHHQAGYERNPRFRLHLFQQPEYVWQV